MGFRRVRGEWGGGRVKLLDPGRQVSRGRPRKAAPEPERPTGPRLPPPPLLPFQREGVDFLKEHDWRVLLADAPGCGKTPQVLTAIRENAAELCPALVVVPASVLRNWGDEAARWAPGMRVHVLARVDTPLRRAAITLLTWDVLAARSEELAAAGFRLLVADEAHYAKNPDTFRSCGVDAVAEAAPHVLLLTGTPLLNEINELEVLRGFFRGESPPMLRRLLEDVAPQIPPKRRRYLTVAIPRDIREEYDQIVHTFADWLDEYMPKALAQTDQADDVTGAKERAVEMQHLVKLAYLRRVLGRGKAPAAAALTYELVNRREAVVLFGHYTDVLDIYGHLLTRLRIPYMRIDGQTPNEARHAAVKAFQAGEVPVLVASSAAREGITLTRAAHLIRLERDYVPAYEEQAEDRIRRIGQTRPTTVWYLHAEGTIDARISEIVDFKRTLVADTIGLADTPFSVEAGVYDAWLKIDPLKAGVPALAVSPRGRVELPRLPPPERVHAVLFSADAWPADALARSLRSEGFRVKAAKVEGARGRVECRVASAFVAGTLRHVQVAPGLVVVGGQRAESAAQRLTALLSARGPVLRPA